MKYIEYLKVENKMKVTFKKMLLISILKRNNNVTTMLKTIRKEIKQQ